MKYFKFAFFFFIVTFSFSQNNDSNLVKGELTRGNFKELKIANVPDDKGGLFTIKYRKNQSIIRHYNNALQIDNEYVHELENQTIISVFFLNNQLNFITYRIDKKTKDALFSSNIFNSETKTIKKNDLFTIPSKHIALKKRSVSIVPSTTNEYEVSNPFENNYQWGFLSDPVATFIDDLGIERSIVAPNEFQWGIKFSKNKKHYVIGFANFEEGKKKLKQKESYRFYFLNDKSELLFDQKITLNHKDKNYFFYDIEVDENLESFYFLGKHFPNGIRGVLKYPTYDFEIHRLTKDTATFTKMNIGNLKIDELNLNIDISANKISAIGLYSNDSEYAAQGLASFSFDKTNLKPISSTHTKFSDQFFKDTQRKKEKYRNFYIDNIYETIKGELFVIGEERTTGGMGRTSDSDPFGTAYFYADIFVAKLNTDGKILWSRAINKNQTVNKKDLTAYLSYTSYVSEKDELNIIFNASQKLKILKDESTRYEFSSFKNIVPFHITFNDIGDYNHKELLNPEEKIILLTRNSLYDNLNKPSNIFFLGKRVTKEMWTKLKLK